MTAGTAAPRPATMQRQTASTSIPALTVLADALDTLLDTGVCIVGDVIVSVGGVDLVRIDLRALVAGVAALDEGASQAGAVR